jgi:hypothetical protein
MFPISEIFLVLGIIAILLMIWSGRGGSFNDRLFHDLKPTSS